MGLAWFFVKKKCGLKYHQNLANQSKKEKKEREKKKVGLKLQTGRVVAAKTTDTDIDKTHTLYVNRNKTIVIVRNTCLATRSDIQGFAHQRHVVN